jgi:hypothetical protein
MIKYRKAKRIKNWHPPITDEDNYSGENFIGRVRKWSWSDWRAHQTKVKFEKYIGEKGHTIHTVDIKTVEEFIDMYVKS